MAHVTAHINIAGSPHVYPVAEHNDLAKLPNTTYLLGFGDFDVRLDRSDIEMLYRDLDCLFGDPQAHAKGRCLHARVD